jgi:hypothetical protein
MSFKEIKQLRQSGDLGQALELANTALAEDPKNVWNLRAKAWVHYEYLKLACNEVKVDAFREQLKAIGELELDEDESIFFDACAWQIGKVLYAMVKPQNANFAAVDDLFLDIRALTFSRPSEAYSFLLKAVCKAGRNSAMLRSVVDWWGLEFLRPEDFRKEEFDGRKLMSLAENVYSIYAKHELGQGIQIGWSNGIAPESLDSNGQGFLQRLEHVIEEYPDLTFLPYFHAKLLLKQGTSSSALDTLIPFAQKKSQEYWVWQLLAEIVGDDEEKQLACYCKALSLKTRAEYLVKIQQKLIAILIRRELFGEAKTELVKLVKTRTEQGWRIHGDVQTWLDSRWFLEAKEFENNKKFYRHWGATAEQLVYSSMPEETVIVSHVNKEKRVLNFIVNKKRKGHFSFKDMGFKPRVGDAICVRLTQVGNNGFYRILTAKHVPLDAHFKHDAIQHYEGKVMKPESKEFAFVQMQAPDDHSNKLSVFVPPHFTAKVNDGDKAKGTAILSYNKSKKNWGWKAISLENN